MNLNRFGILSIDNESTNILVTLKATDHIHEIGTSPLNNNPTINEKEMLYSNMLDISLRSYNNKTLTFGDDHIHQICFTWNGKTYDIDVQGMTDYDAGSESTSYENNEYRPSNHNHIISSRSGGLLVSTIEPHNMFRGSYIQISKSGLYDGTYPVVDTPTPKSMDLFLPSYKYEQFKFSEPATGNWNIIKPDQYIMDTIK